MSFTSGSSNNLSPEKRRSRLTKFPDQKEERRASPLSFAQQRLWILDRFQPGNPAYNIPAAMPLQGWVDTKALERSLHEIVRRHEALRTTFEVIDGKPAQVVAPSLNLKMEIVDLRYRPRASVTADLNRIIFEEGRRPFDLAKGPLVRATLVTLDSMNHVLMLVMHHIVSDGWSMSVFYRELSTLYMAFLRGQPSPLPELPIQYADFAQWQTDWFRGPVLEEQLSYWRKQLTGLRPVLDLATDRPRPPVQTSRGDLRGFMLERSLCEDLKSLSQAQGATLFMTLLAAFKTLLHRLSGETDIAVGSPIANRTRSELENLIGFFVNTLVLRTDLSGDPTFLELLRREREVALGAYGHQDMPFEKLVEGLQPERELSHNPLFQILFAVQNIGIVDRNAPKPPPTQAAPVGNGTAKFDLTLSLLDTGAGAQGFLEFNTDLFDAATSEMMIERYQTLLRGVVDYPDRRLSQLPILTAAERKEFPTGQAGPKIEATHNETVGEMVSARVASAPESVAVINGKSEISYAELNARANQFARRLRALGITEGNPVAVSMARGKDELIAILGILKAGGVYVPIDSSELALPGRSPEILPPRIERLLAVAQPKLIVVNELTRPQFPPALDCLFSFSDLQAEAGDESDADPQVVVKPESIASLVYQTDADGVPRVVALTHRALCRAACHPLIQIEDSDRVAYLSHACSDRARFEIFGALAAGAAVVCLPDDLSAAPRRFAGALRELGATILFAPASTFEHLAREFPWALRKLRLLLSDERLRDWQHLSELLKPEVLEQMYSLYGDPQAGGYFAVQPLASLAADSSAIPLGAPAPGVTAYVLDNSLELAPMGISGELYIETDSLAHDFDDAAEAFIPSPFSAVTDSFLYHTGDIARRLPDGSIDYRGRRDGRIMIAGVLVYPAEIESVLREHPQVRDAAVSPRRRHRLRERGLAAFIEFDEDAPTESELRDFLTARLPAYLIPTAYNTNEAIPRLATGAVDRRALADAAAEVDMPKVAPEPYVEPRNEIETALAQIWMETLGTDRIGIKDNFFRLGGHSLLATQAVARISDAFQLDLQLQRLFEAPTIEQLARVIEPLARADYKPEILSIMRVPRDKPLPLSFAQQRLWFLDQFEPDSAFYNIAMPIRLSGPLNVGVLQAAFNDLIERHETLRTTFDTANGEPAQIISPSYTLPMPVHDLRSLPEPEREAEAQRLATIEAQRPFNLKTGPVLRTELVKLSDTEHLLLFTIHHIAADGWSIDVLFRELGLFQEARWNKRPAELPELKVQYADFACWQRKRLSGVLLDKQLAYWKRHLDGAPGLLELPTDRPRPRVQMFRGGMHTFSMPASLLESVKAISEQEQTTLFNVLLAGFNVLLYRYTGREDLVVGSPIANRTRPELESLIGFFANTLVLRTQMSGQLSFCELIGRVREVTLGAYTHQDIPFEKLVEEFQPERNLSYNPIFQVMFALQNTGRPTAMSPAQDHGTPVIGAGVAKFDLTMFVSETTAGLQVGIEYNSDLFDASTIARVGAHYEILLSAAVAKLDQPLWTLPMLSSDESLSLAEWNETAAPFERTCVHQMFEAQAVQMPDAPALIFQDRALTYQELNSRANYWAHRLIELGAGPDACVGILMERSPDMIVAVLATLKAGAAYVPLDPSYPAERIAFMLTDSRAPVLLTETRLGERMPETAARVLMIDQEKTEAQRTDNPPHIARAENLCYVIYTSGSTGVPKGVAMPHAPLTNLVQWQIARSKLPPGASTLQFASLSFDVSFQEIFSTLCAGGSLVLVTEEQRRDPEALWRVLREAGIRRLFLPYVALQQLAEQAKQVVELPSTLTEVITAGEQLQITPQIAALFERLNASLYNQYGPTESHVVTELELKGQAREWPTRPAIGRPIPNAVIHIFDSFGQPCAIGIPGELYIGGEALALGYIQRADLTAERFNPDAQGTGGERLYRTGDRARYMADGNLQFLGRVDDQVKIRGFRVEPGEVEEALRKYPAVSEAVVIARTYAAEEFRLTAYVQADSRNAPSSHQLRTHLASLLPEYMIPAAFVVTASLPLTPSGKLNRRALPAPELSANDLTPTINARTPVETSLAAIWRDVLELPRIGMQDNFFELGGHSLLATRVISRMRDEFNVDLPVRRIFESPTIEALAISVVESVMEAQSLDETARLLAEIEQLSDEEAHVLFRDDV